MHVPRNSRLFRIAEISVQRTKKQPLMMEYKHFSHPHSLKLLQFQKQDRSNAVCSGCKSAVSGTAYVCSSEGCNFSLHQQCGNAARGMQHPSHALHHLTLVPYTTYSSGTFLCNACGNNGGKGFSFCCPLCDFDLHARCALLPQAAVHESHPMHNLVLAYNSAPPMAFAQFSFANQFICNVCKEAMDFRFWSYNCYACNCHMHPWCALNEPKPETDDLEGSVPNGLQQESAASEKDKAVAGETCNDRSAAEEPKSVSNENEFGTRQNDARTASATALIQTGTTAQVENPALRRQLELQQIQHQLDMNAALANMMGSFNLSSFV